jgi:hypothetical protein
MKNGLEVEMKNNRPWAAFAIVVMLFAMSLNIAAQTPPGQRQKESKTAKRRA